jgi:hypothetical protein
VRVEAIVEPDFLLPPRRIRMHSDDDCVMSSGGYAHLTYIKPWARVCDMSHMGVNISMDRRRAS